MRAHSVLAEMRPDLGLYVHGCGGQPSPMANPPVNLFCYMFEHIAAGVVRGFEPHKTSFMMAYMTTKRTNIDFFIFSPPFFLVMGGSTQ